MALEDRVDKLEKRMDRVEDRLDTQAQKITDLKQTVNVNLWQMALQNLKEA